MMKKIIAYVQCNDQPGLISTISKSITESNGNIETSKMIKLESHFNMIILISINEKDQIKFRRSIYVVRDIDSGEVLTKENIRSIRPGYGLPPKYFNELIGKRVKSRVEKGTPLDWDMLEK